jgi:hypothetical protein
LQAAQSGRAYAGSQIIRDAIRPLDPWLQLAEPAVANVIGSVGFTP